MRRGELYRYRDPSGVSGTGVVAQVCLFGDGSLAVRWLGRYPSTAVWPDVDSVIAVHGHLGASEIRWLDPDPLDPEAEMVTAGGIEPGPGGRDEGQPLNGGWR